MQKCAWQTQHNGSVCVRRGGWVRRQAEVPVLLLCCCAMCQICRRRLEAVRKQHAALKQQLEGHFSHLDGLEAKVWYWGRRRGVA